MVLTIAADFDNYFNFSEEQALVPRAWNKLGGWVSERVIEYAIFSMG